MPKTIIAEGRTTNEAVSNGLKELHVSRDSVNIKVLESGEKRSFFSILTPRVVKVELTVKDEVNIHSDKNIRRIENANEYNTQHVNKNIKPEDIEISKKNIENFLEEFSKNFEDISYTVKYEGEFICVEMRGKSSSKLIGYRGDVLNSLQTVLNSIACKNCESKIKVILNIENYKEKREKSLEELADKVSRTVLRTGKSITLEPMVAYERKIIHNRLQQNNYVKTYSIGDEPYRKVVIAKK